MESTLIFGSDQVDAERRYGGLNVIQVGDGMLTIYKHTFANKYTARCGMSFLGASLSVPSFFAQDGIKHSLPRLQVLVAWLSCGHVRFYCMALKGAG